MMELFAGLFTSLFGSLGIAIMIVLWFLFLGILGFGVWWYRLHTIDMEIGDEANNVVRPAGIFRARYTLVAGVPCVKFMNWWMRKHVAPMPKKEALSVAKNGRWYVHAIRKSNEQYSYYSVSADVNANVKGIDTNSKMLYLKNLYEANKRKKLTWQEALPVIANSIAFITLVIILIVMVPNVYDKHMQITTLQAQITDKQSSAMTVLAQACTNTQFIQSSAPFLSLANNSGSPAVAPN